MSIAASSLPYAKLHFHDPTLNENPHTYYAELRRGSPICRTKDRLFRGRDGYLLSRYEDVRLILTDARFSSDPKASANGSPSGIASVLQRFRMLNLLTDSMVFKDDPDHKRLRGLVNVAFTNRRVQELEAGVRQIVDGLFDAIAAKGEADFVEEFAVPLPLAVISQMLGVSPNDRDRFYRWTRKFTGGASSGPAGLMRSMPTGYKMLGLFKRLVKERRAEADDKLISAIVQARHEGEQLDDQEVLAMIFLLLLAGHDTTANLINMSALMFIEHPDQLQQLRDNPDLIDTAIEELVRYTTPVTNPTPRRPKEDVEFHGVAIAKGTPLLGMIISANRDEEVFPEPNKLDLGRTPNRHLAFGFGGHFCLGAMLARLEARIALQTLVDRFAHIELAVPRDQIRYKAAVLRGLASLPLRLRE